MPQVLPPHIKDIVTAIREAVLEVLQPFMNETRAGLEAVRRDVEELKTQTTSEVIGNAALQKLLPYMNRMEGNLQNRVNSLARDLEEVNEKVCDLTETEFPIVKSNLTTLKETTTNEIRAVKRQLERCNNHTMCELDTLHAALWSNNTDQLTQICAKMDAMDLRLASLSSALNLTAVENQAKEHNNQVTSKLVVLQTKQDVIHSKIGMLDSKQDELEMKLISVNSELEQDILSNVTMQLQRTYHLHDSSGYTCGSTGGWRRVVYLDMTDPNTNCPSGWQLNTRYSKRTCDTGYGGFLTCDSVFFPVGGGAYNRVCGTIRGFQFQFTSAFRFYHRGVATTIDEAYVCGVSLTHGSPRQHIWTFAAGNSEHHLTSDYSCPCDAIIDIKVPSFVGKDYFCESGVNSMYGASPLQSDDPLWDGKNCTSSSRCCTFSNPPYFTKRLSSATTDDIEARLCQSANNVETPIEFIELFVKLDNVDIKEIEKNILSGVEEDLQRTYDILQSDFGKMNVHVCGGIGGWRRVLDMTDPNTNCPSGWKITDFSKRTCDTGNNGYLTCESAFFPVSGGAYNKVCGKIIGYQYQSTGAFQNYNS